MIGIEFEPVTEPVTEKCAPAPPRRVLIVEDDPSQLDVLRHRFSSQGFATLSASTGRQGLELAFSQLPDLVVLDIEMPDTDGLTVCQQLSDDRTTCGIPIIILSGHDHPDVVRQARAAGCRYFIRKPYDPNALLILAQTALTDAAGW